MGFRLLPHVHPRHHLRRTFKLGANRSVRPVFDILNLGNINTTPEGFGFYGLLYSQHAGFSNLARFKLAEYDRLYEQARAMPDGPERTRVLRKLSGLVTAYAPWVLLAFRYESVLVQPWVIGYKYNPTYQYPFPYLDLDLPRRVQAAR